MNAEPRSRWRSIAEIAATAVALASIAVALLLTRTTWFRDQDADGAWHLRALWAAMLLWPAAILLFALGVQWALRRRVVPALPALAALPAWVISLHWTRLEVPARAAAGAEAVLVNANVLVNDCWLAIVMMQMQGMQPFGSAP